jgi:hypothetical protein
MKKISKQMAARFKLADAEENQQTRWYNLACLVEELADLFDECTCQECLDRHEVWFDDADLHGDEPYVVFYQADVDSPCAGMKEAQSILDEQNFNYNNSRGV